MNNEITSLQFLRGFFTVLVLLAHVNLMVDVECLHGLFKPGWCGVDMFFTLSGFLAIYTYHSGKTLRKYIFKKFIRLYPVLFSLTLLFLLLSLLSISLMDKNVLTEWTDVGYGWHSTICSFLILPTDTSINDMPIVPPAWTLPYEVLFYIVGILLIVKEMRHFFYVCMVWMLLIFLNHFFLIVTDYPWNFFFDLLFVEFFLGMWIAWILRFMSNQVIRSFFYKYSLCFFCIGAGGVCISYIGILINNDIIIQLHRVIKFGIPFTLVLLGLTQGASHAIGTWFTKTWFYHFMLECAKKSYSLYLMHFVTATLFVRVLKKVSFLDNGIRFFLVALVCYFAGVLVWYLVEEPLSRYLRKLLKV